MGYEGVKAIVDKLNGKTPAETSGHWREVVDQRESGHGRDAEADQGSLE
jgi:hypothetical protein